MCFVTKLSIINARRKNERSGKATKYGCTGVNYESYTYSEARQNLSELLSLAESEEIIIQRRGGKTFTVNFIRN